MENLSIGEINRLRLMGLSWTLIAGQMGVSRATLWNFRIASNHSDPYDEDQVRQAVRQFTVQFPNGGELMLRGYLRSEIGMVVQRDRLREIINEEDPGGRERRKSPHLKRSAYQSEGPGHVWHLDTHHKLGKFGFVVFVCIDGFSRQIVALRCQIDNKATTALASLTSGWGIQTMGLPQLMRGDLGGENIAIARFFNSIAGPDHFIFGSSPENCRAERIHRDTMAQILVSYYNFFRSLADVDFNEPRNVWVIQYLFQQRIDGALQLFMDSWNSHPMKSVNMLSPNAQVELSYQLGKENRYIRGPIDDRARAAIESLEQDYEGRASARGQCPFGANQNQLLEFCQRVQPISLATAQADFRLIVANAFDVIRELILNSCCSIN